MRRLGKLSGPGAFSKDSDPLLTVGDLLYPAPVEHEEGMSMKVHGMRQVRTTSPISRCGVDHHKVDELVHGQLH